MERRITLKEAERFHGHLGPYLILGILAGELALKNLACKKYFDLEVKVWGAIKKPRSCFIDGLQLSTGATYGKGNISKINGQLIRAEFKSCSNNKRLILKFKGALTRKIEKAVTHRDSELLARKLYRTNASRIFVTCNY